MNQDESPSTAAAPLTELLRRAAGGESAAADVAMPLVYRQLRRLAKAKMAGERPGHTLQATGLVHETWVKLLGMGPADWPDRAAFYRAAVTAMRRILVDYARRRLRRKRGGGHGGEPVPVDSLPAPAAHDAAEFLQLDQELARLEAEDPRAAAIVKLRYFAGLGVDETASALGLSRRTVLREWAWARARLFAALHDGDQESDAS